VKSPLPATPLNSHLRDYGDESSFPDEIKRKEISFQSTPGTLKKMRHLTVGNWGTSGSATVSDFELCHAGAAHLPSGLGSPPETRGWHPHVFSPRALILN